jgi:hypothetical protein
MTLEELIGRNDEVERQMREIDAKVREGGGYADSLDGVGHVFAVNAGVALESFDGGLSWQRLGDWPIPQQPSD